MPAVAIKAVMGFAPATNYALATLVAGCAIGLVPAFKAYHNPLADGLSMRL